MTAMSLYSRRTLRASLVLILAGAASFTSATAQRRKPHKLRATALVELTTSQNGTTTARVVPVTILDDGSFHDAGIYKNTPQPMALGVGVVYEAQKTGQTVGYVTVGNAKREVNGSWSASGRWQSAEAKPAAQAAAAAPPPSSTGDRPIIHRPGSSGSTPAASPTPSATGGSNPSTAPSDDRPVLHRTSGGDPAPAQSTPSPTPPPTPAPAPAAAEAPEDPNRPTLRHRTPSSAQQETEVRPAPQPSARPAASAAAAPKPPVSVSAAPGTQTLVAVSDTQASESRSYDVVWKAGEQEAVETKMRRLALDQLPHDGSGALQKDNTLAALANVVIRGFDLDLSNDAVVVLTAEILPGALAAAKPAAKAATKSTAGTKNQQQPAASSPAPTSNATRYITVIARLDLDGNPQKLAASVTDSSRLDVVPRLELIDAVDVDGDGLGKLLFRQYSFDEKSFVIFAIGRSTVTKLFEGASQPLRP